MPSIFGENLFDDWMNDFGFDREFFGKKTMEQIVMAINREDAGGEGRGDEFIEKYARLTMAEKEVAGNGK